MLSETSQLISLTGFSLLTARTGYSPLSRSVPSIPFLLFLGPLVGVRVRDQLPKALVSLCTRAGGGQPLLWRYFPLLFRALLAYFASFSVAMADDGPSPRPLSALSCWPGPIGCGVWIWKVETCPISRFTGRCLASVDLSGYPVALGLQKSLFPHVNSRGLLN